jgi:predicted nucleic acid-binding protein
VTYVVDASVAIKWFVRENLHAEAARVLDRAGHLEAPDLIVAEVANVAWKKAVRGEIGRPQAQLIATAMRQYVPTLHPSAGLIEQALEIALALNHPVYDCLYLACAEAVDGILITADRRLCKALADSDYASLAHHLADS